jgi:hypothetical protein
MVVEDQYRGFFYFQGGHLLSEIRAIETRYNGYRFRSRLEARWAVFFDACGIKYEYEPEGFVLPSGKSYLPDFYLPELGIYVEVKREDGDVSKAVEFGLTIDSDLGIFGIAIFFGNPRQDYFSIINSNDYENKEDAPFNREFYFAPKKFEDTFIIGWRHVTLCPWWDEKMPYKFRLEAVSYIESCDADIFLYLIDKLEKAIVISNEARFEFGETPKGPKD